MFRVHRILLLPLAASLAGATVFAQVSSQNSPLAAPSLRGQLQKQEQTADREPLDPRQNQKIERIVTEDAGSRIDELRVGGQTQSIVVQPKADVPAYEVQPATGQRYWNVFRF
jgi:hypothetical protein